VICPVLKSSGRKKIHFHRLVGDVFQPSYVGGEVDFFRLFGKCLFACSKSLILQIFPKQVACCHWDRSYSKILSCCTT
jgi:hypothetical protein